MIKDFINGGKYYNFSNLEPDEDFFTSIKSVHEYLEKGEDVNNDVCISCVSFENYKPEVIKLSTNIPYIPTETLETTVDTKDAAMQPNSDGTYDKNGRTINYCYSKDIILVIKADVSNKSENVEIPRCLITRNMNTNEVISILPGFPINLTENFGADRINLSNITSKIKNISTLLFGNSSIVDSWRECNLVLLTQDGVNKISQAYKTILKDSGSVYNDKYYNISTYNLKV